MEGGALGAVEVSAAFSPDHSLVAVVAPDHASHGSWLRLLVLVAGLACMVLHLAEQADVKLATGAGLLLLLRSDEKVVVESLGRAGSGPFQAYKISSCSLLFQFGQVILRLFIFAPLYGDVGDDRMAAVGDWAPEVGILHCQLRLLELLFESILNALFMNSVPTL